MAARTIALPMDGLNVTSLRSGRPDEKTRNYCWFGHTTSLTPHLVPNCEVKSGQATSSTVLGDYTGTGCAERFIFLNLYYNIQNIITIDYYTILNILMLYINFLVYINTI